jgi:hypothetical protein
MFTRLKLTAAVLALTAGTAFAQQTDITIGMQLEPPNLDPTGGAAAAIDEVVYANVFEGLTRYRSDGSIAPALAERWEVSDDGRTYTFHLRQGVRFHDGTDMTAEDVKFSLDRARAENSTNAQKALFAGIFEVRVVDDHTVEVELTGPNSAFPTNMAWGDAVIVAPESVDRRRPSRWAPARSSSRAGCRATGSSWCATRLLGRDAGAGKRDLQVHLGPDGGLLGDDGRRHRRLPGLPGARDTGPVRGRSAVPSADRLDRGRDHPRDEQPGRGAARRARAPGHRARRRPAGDHRRGDVRLRHADRHAFRAAPSRLRRSDRAVLARSRGRGRCWPRRAMATG